MLSFRPRLLLAILLLSALAPFTSGCSTNAASSPDMQLMSLEEMPAEVQAAPVVVSQAYRFAAANPDAARQIPCYCGCGAIGHTSNYSCYVAGLDGNGAIIFDNHALGCSLCVDITQDTMRLLREGRSLPEIRAYVDSAYSKYGASNMP